jgi:hypothetical protein
VNTVKFAAISETLLCPCLSTQKLW